MGERASSPGRAVAGPDESGVERPAPVPGWVGIVALARAAARGADPPCTFACDARHGRLAWRDVRGSAAFVDLLWVLEELSAVLCEVCGAPARLREIEGGVLRTLCPHHLVAVVAAGPRVEEIYAQAWRTDEPPMGDGGAGWVRHPAERA